MPNLLEVGVAFTLGSLTIKWYGIIIATGVLVAVLIACHNANLKKYSKDFPYELLLWCFPLAIIGARIYYIIFSGQSYTFQEAIAIWNGGMAIYGGIIGGLIGLILYSIIKNKNLLQITDIVAPSLIIAQAIGRWGNFANQEVYGQVVTSTAQQWFPLAVYIEKLGEWHYAMFFYESMLCLIGFILLMYLFSRTKSYGIVTSVYLIYYGLERFILEGMREESEILFISGTKIPVSQVVSVAFVVAGLIILSIVLISAHKKAKVSAGIQPKLTPISTNARSKDKKEIPSNPDVSMTNANNVCVFDNLKNEENSFPKQNVEITNIKELKDNQNEENSNL